ncbi:MAG: carbohydrate kinase [Bacteroides sp.]
MRKVIGIGETILDVIFRNEQPSAAVPGGSVFNGILSLAKAGVKVCFISEIGNDRVGKIIKTFMEDNRVDTQYISIFPDGKSPVSLAFLDENSNAEYSFYKDYPKQRLDVNFPNIEEDDILILGSYYALNPVLREKMVELLEQAKEKKAIIYYDPNFRSTHKNEAIKLTSTIIENLEYADIVRGSDEDFYNLYKLTDPDKIYKNKIQFYCRNFLCTSGEKEISLRTQDIRKQYKIEPLKAVCTIGAGDNFNAGILYGLIKYNIRYRDLETMNETDWDKVIQCGIEFSANVCMSFSNSISEEFAAKVHLKESTIS